MAFVNEQSSESLATAGAISVYSTLIRMKPLVRDSHSVCNFILLINYNSIVCFFEL